MRLLLSVVTIVASLSLQAQHKTTAGKILIGFNFSPDYSFRTLKNNDGSSSTDIIIKNRNNIEIAKLGYTTGVNVIFNFSKQTQFETGIQYSNKGYKTKNQNLYYTNPGPNLPLSYKTNYAYQYIGIPLKARFLFGKTKLHFIASAGLMANFLLTVKSTFTYFYTDGKTETKKQSSASGFNKVDIAPMASIGVEYKINNKIQLVAEPTFRYGVIKTINAPVVERLWSGGLNIGFYHLLNCKR